MGCDLRGKLKATLAVGFSAAIFFAASKALPAQLQIQVIKPTARHGAKPAQVASIPGAAPVLDATDVGSPLQLEKDWRVGITADPAAGSADFDDSAWAVRNAEPIIDDVSEDESAGATSTPANAGAGKTTQKNSTQHFAWFRIHIKLAPNHGPLALLAGMLPDVFANGVKLAPDGPHGNAPQRYQAISRTYQLNIPADETSLVLAVRTLYIPYGYGSYTTFFGGRSFSLGNPGDLARELNLWSNRSLFERLHRRMEKLVDQAARQRFDSGKLFGGQRA